MLDRSHVSGSKKEPSPASEKRGPRPWRARSGSFFWCARHGARNRRANVIRGVSWGWESWGPRSTLFSEKVSSEGALVGGEVLEEVEIAFLLLSLHFQPFHEARVDEPTGGG